ncbi:MAG: cadherin repeat domain-containing protein [Chloroflexi bacterium]|nr:cadherin repeat domain-containing protein [Chloroflexota bacterium]
MIHALYRSLGSLRAWVTVIIGAVAATATWRSPVLANAAAPPGAASSSSSHRKYTLPLLALLAAVALVMWLLLPGGALQAQDQTIEYAENGKDPVATFTADDPEGATSITWSLATDTTIDDVEAADIVDNASFSIDKDGVLKFASPPDFENPADTNATANTYKVVVLAADAATGGQTGYYKLTVKVTNEDEPGKVTLTTSTTNGTPQYLVGATLTATAEDGDITNATQTFTTDVAGEVAGVTWRWYSGGTEITGADAQDNTYTLLQGDAGKHIRAVVYYVVTGNTDQDMAEITTDYPVLAARVGASQLEFDPETVSRTISEGDKGRNVGAPVTAMGNHGTIRYGLADSGDGTSAAPKFEIDAKTGQITTAVDLSYEATAGEADNCVAQNACVVTVTATDSTGEAAATPATVNIAITNVGEKPTFPTEALEMLESPENRDALFDTTDGPVTTEAGVTYVATDPEGRNITYRLMGPDAAKFQLSATRVLSFKEDQEPDYEMPGDANRDNVYEVTVRASDGTMYADQMVKVTVTDEDEGPIVTGMDTINYAENGKGAVGTFMARDPEGRTTITWSLATDSSIDGVETADVADNASFMIDEDGMLKFASPPDFENPADTNATDNTYKVVVLAADAATDGQTGYHKVTVKVTNLNEPGEITWITSTSNGTPQFLVGATLTATAEDGDITNTTQTFTADVADEVAGVTWRWYSGGSEIATATTNSYQLQDSDAGKHIRVVVRYQVDGNTSQESAQLTTDYPVLRARVGASQLEFDPPTVSRTISEGDKERNVGAPVTAMGNHGTIRYELGGADANRFDIDAKTGQITTEVDLNFEGTNGADDQCTAANACVVTVTATDSTGETGPTATVNIKITDVDEKPVFTETAGTALSPEIIMSPENRAALFDTTDGPVTTEAGVTYAATDPEGLNVNLSLMGSDAARFTLSAAGVLSFVKAPDREMPGDANGDNVYEVTVRADEGTMTADRMVRVTVTNVDEAPVITAGGLVVSGLTSVSYAEDRTDAVATYTARGEDPTNARWTLSGADAGDFTLSARTGASTMLRFRSSPNYEAPADADTNNVYMVTVTANDGTNTAMRDVTVTVTDVDEQGTGDALVDRYDANTNGEIEKGEVIAAINDYLDEGTNAPTKADVIRLINLYLDA